MIFYTDEQSADVSNAHNNNHVNHQKVRTSELLNEDNFQSRREEMKRNYSSSGESSFQISDIFYKEKADTHNSVNGERGVHHRNGQDYTVKDISNRLNGISLGQDTKQGSRHVANQIPVHNNNNEVANQLPAHNNNNEVVRRRDRIGLVSANDLKRVSFQDESKWLDGMLLDEVETQRLKKMYPERYQKENFEATKKYIYDNHNGGEIISRSVSMPYIPSSRDDVEENSIRLQDRKEWLEVMGQRQVDSLEREVTADKLKINSEEKNLTGDNDDEDVIVRGSAYLLPSEIRNQQKQPRSSPTNSDSTRGKSSSHGNRQSNEMYEHGSHRYEVNNKHSASSALSVQQKVHFGASDDSNNNNNNNNNNSNSTVEEEHCVPKMKDALKIFQVIEGSRKKKEQFD